MTFRKKDVIIYLESKKKKVIKDLHRGFQKEFLLSWLTFFEKNVIMYLEGERKRLKVLRRERVTSHDMMLAILKKKCYNIVRSKTRSSKLISKRIFLE